MILMAKAVRTWMAIAFVALYAACVIVPPIVQAFENGHHLAEKAHLHASDIEKNPKQHNHMGGAPDPADEHQQWSAPAIDVAFAVLFGTSPARFAVMQDLAGLSPDKLIRPPKSQS